MTDLSTSEKIRLAFIATLWLALLVLLFTSQPLTPRVLFVAVASGIIVWVPLYKKYIKPKR